jgi:hypothetical protein
LTRYLVSGWRGDGLAIHRVITAIQGHHKGDPDAAQSSNCRAILITQVRYSLVITPVNYSLAAVNFFVGSTGMAQLYRIWDYRRTQPQGVEGKVKEALTSAAN